MKQSLLDKIVDAQIVTILSEVTTYMYIKTLNSVNGVLHYTEDDILADRIYPDNVVNFMAINCCSCVYNVI